MHKHGGCAPDPPHPRPLTHTPTHTHPHPRGVQCGLQPVTDCVPEVDDYVAGNFSSVAPSLQAAAANCSAGGGPPTTVTCAGQADCECVCVHAYWRVFG